MKKDPRLKARARELRRAITPAEKILWRELRGRRFAGFKFRRQQPIGAYIADFYCPACSLVIELDGETYLGREGEDRSRQEYFEGLGLKVLRFWNTAVFEDVETVLEVIFDNCQERRKAPPPHP